MSSISSTPDVTTTHNFARKQITATFYTPAEPGKVNIFTVGQGHAIEASISHSGMGIGSELTMTINGITSENSKTLTIVPDYPNADNLNTNMPGRTIVSIQVGNYGQSLTNVFIGSVVEAYTDYNDPNLPFHIYATVNNIFNNFKPKSKGYNGGQHVISLLNDICQEVGLRLINHGGWDRHAILHNHYRWGSYLEQIKDIVKAIKGVFNFTPYPPTGDQAQMLTMDGTAKISRPFPKGILEIWGPGFNGISEPTTTLGNVSQLSTHNGMIGYPTYSQKGISLTSLLRPDFKFRHPIMLDNHDNTHFPHASLWQGLWLPTLVRHEISSEIKGGKWHTHLDCIRTNLGKKEQTT